MGMRSFIVAFALALSACGPQLPDGPGLSFGATPSRLSASQPTSELKLVAWDQTGAPGVGTVLFSASAGALLEGTSLELSQGTATVTFRCIAGTDPGCSGAAEVEAQWRGLSQSVSVKMP